MGVHTFTGFKSAFSLVDVLSLPLFALIIIRCAQITVARSPRQLNFVYWHLMLVDPQYGTCAIPPFWHLEFSFGSYIFGKFVPCCILVWLNKFSRKFNIDCSY